MVDERARSGGASSSSDPTDGPTDGPIDGPIDGRARGRVLDGRYRLGARIARGGMASVYEAQDLRLDRTVAVKIMHAGLGDGQGDREFAERFVREARAAARLSHPNVVAVYDQGDDDGTVYLVMELISGHTLRDTILKESPMAPARALALMEPVLSALASAHRAGLIHRDVKPENVLIADDGRVKVADFGLAKAVSADTQHTATQGVLIGTVSYLAPELVVDGRADARADVYAAGVVLYELLTGVKPHEGETPIQVAYKHVHHDVPPPSERVARLPAYVDALVARATARERSLRPADAAVLLHQVHRVSHALADGVRDDPELTQDLTPLLTASIDDQATDDRATDDRATDDQATRAFARPPGDTAPQAWDDAVTSALAAGTTSPTTRFAAPSPRPVSGERAPRPLPLPRAETLAPAAGTPAPRRPRRPRRSRRGLLLLVAALVLAVGVGGGAFWFGWARYTASPSVLGATRAEAETAMDDAGLAVDYTDPTYDSEVAKGAVVDADPVGGTRVQQGDTVTLTLSLGKLLVPKVRGMDEDAAQDALLARQLDFGERVDRYSETQPEGTVLGSRPKAGVEAASGDSVDLIVSQGRRPITVGRWEGDNLEEVTAKIENRGLVAQVTSEEYSDTVPEGAIISQSPSGGTLFTGDTVSLVVSKGPELVEVPSVRAFGVEAARQRLEELGFVVETEQNSEYLGLGFAVRTDPESGSMAPKGSRIVLYVL